uniref:Uncharacterized protein n=1 Tax=Aegilops tauschii subsp. strangulata TaxID=200361 RepID=A0A453AQ49_AEGTS
QTLAHERPVHGRNPTHQSRSTTHQRPKLCPNPLFFLSCQSPHRLRSSQRNPGDPRRPLPGASGKMAEHLFEDIFHVTRIDPDGKKFDRVNRIEARSEQLEMYMQLDIATDVYPMHMGDKFTMVLAPTLNLDGTPDTGYYTQV